MSRRMYVIEQTAPFRRKTMAALTDGRQEIDMNRDRFEGNWDLSNR